MASTARALRRQAERLLLGTLMTVVVAVGERRLRRAFGRRQQARPGAADAAG